MVTYYCCVHTAVPAAYSMLLYNENVSVINAVLLFLQYELHAILLLRSP